MASKKAIPWFKLQTGLIHAPVWQDIYLKYGSHGMGVALLTVSFIAENEGFKCHVDKLSSYCRKFLVEDEEMLHYILHESGLFSISRSGFTSSEWLDESVKQYVTRSEGAKEAAAKKTQLPTQLPGQLPTQLPDTEERNKNKEDRIENKDSIDLNTSNQEKKEKEKKEDSSQAADSAPIHVVAQHGTKTRKKKIDSNREGFFIQGVKGGESYELQVTDVKQPEIVEWLQKSLSSFIAQQEDWLTKDHIWKLWKSFYEKEKVGYSNNWAGLHTHFCSYVKRARRSEFTTPYQHQPKPERHVKPELKSNRPPEGYFDQTLPIDNPRDADAITAYLIEQDRIEKEKREALKAQQQNG